MNARVDAGLKLRVTRTDLPATKQVPTMLRTSYTQSPLAARAQVQNSISGSGPRISTADAGPSRAMPSSSHPNRSRRIIQDNTERESICTGSFLSLRPTD